MTGVTASTRTKRVYDPVSPEDGIRILVDRIWPRGVSKAEADVAVWLKDIAPSSELRRWFHHDPALWDGFQLRYRLELAANRQAVDQLRALLEKGTATLVFAARDQAHNNAVALAAYMQESLTKAGRGST